MKFLKPTPMKIFLALILTVLSYIISYIFVTTRGEGTNIISDAIQHYSFLYHIWIWSPSSILAHLFFGSFFDNIWQSDIFIFFIFPFIAFIIRYVLVCLAILFINNAFKRTSLMSIVI